MKEFSHSIHTRWVPFSFHPSCYLWHVPVFLSIPRQLSVQIGWVAISPCIPETLIVTRADHHNLYEIVQPFRPTPGGYRLEVCDTKLFPFSFEVSSAFRSNRWVNCYFPVHSLYPYVGLLACLSPCSPETESIAFQFTPRKLSLIHI